MLWAESIGIQCKACSNLLVMSTAVCTDMVVKRALSLQPLFILTLNYQQSLKKVTISSIRSCQKITLNYTKSAQIALILTFTLTAAFFLHSRVDLMICRKRVL